MRHVASRVLAVLSLAGVAWLFVAFVGKSSALTAERQAIAEMKEANASVVEAAYRDKRANSLKYAHAVAVARSAERQSRARLDAELVSTAYALDSAKAVLADSLASNITLRYSLTATVAKVDTLLAVVSHYKTVADSLEAKYSAERVVLLSVLSKADEVIAAKNDALKGWRNAAECRIVFGIRCPTRTTAFVGGIIVTGALVIALR